VLVKVQIRVDAPAVAILSHSMDQGLPRANV